MKEIGFLRSKHLPPSTVFMQGRLRHPFRLYANKDGNICVIICEITINREGLYTIASAILDWAEKNGSNEIVILDGVASSKHDKKAFCAAEVDLCRVMEEHGINMIPFFIFYSMFGFQRVGDFIWAACDMRKKGFLIGKTRNFRI